MSLAQFVENVTATGLVSAGEVAAICDHPESDERPADAKALARLLVQRKKLTPYQATAILRGEHRGLVFHEYVILDRIGAGGMGVVLKARHRRMDRTVAIKVLPAAAMKSPDAVARFYREVQAVARLSHPHIVAAHDASEHEGMHYLVMGYVDGRDLAALVQERGPLSIAEAADCLLQAAKGLEYAHAMGIVHRDIKPSNLLLARDGVLKILDLGLALLGERGLAQAPVAGQLTQTWPNHGHARLHEPRAGRQHASGRRAE